MAHGESEADYRREIIVYGRLLGTSTGWDLTTDFGMVLYEFQPAPGVMLKGGCDLNVDLEEGLAVYYGDGMIESMFDLVDVLRDLPRASSLEEMKAVVEALQD